MQSRMLTIMQIDGTFPHDERSKGLEARFKSYLIKHIREHKYRGYTRWPEDVNIVFERVNKILFSARENNIHIFKLPCNVRFITWSEQSNREHRNPAGKHTRFSRVTYFFISSLVKIWEIRVFWFTVKHP